MKLTAELVGQTGELEAALYFSRQGCTITWPRSARNPGYDFIAELNGHMTKVQVKAGNSYENTSKSPVVSCNIDPKKCDVVYVAHIGTNQRRLYPAKSCPVKVTFPKTTSHQFDVKL